MRAVSHLLDKVCSEERTRIAGGMRRCREPRVARASEDDRKESLSLRSSPDDLLEAHGVADRLCSLVCVLLSRSSTQERLLAVYSCNFSTFVFTPIFLICLPYYLAESLTSKQDTTVVGVVAGLLLFVAVLLVAVLVVVIYKRCKKPEVTATVTLPLVGDNVPGPG